MNPPRFALSVGSDNFSVLIHVFARFAYFVTISAICFQQVIERRNRLGTVFPFDYVAKISTSFEYYKYLPYFLSSFNILLQ